MATALNPKPVIEVVDDDPSVLRALDRLMRSHGCVVRTFSSGKEYLKALTVPPADCLILDVQMPEMSGLDLHARLRSLGCKVPLIFITAHEDVQAEQLALSNGAVAFFYKPLRNQVLWNAVCSAIGQAPNPSV